MLRAFPIPRSVGRSRSERAVGPARAECWSIVGSPWRSLWASHSIAGASTRFHSALVFAFGIRFVVPILVRFRIRCGFWMQQHFAVFQLRCSGKRGGSLKYNSRWLRRVRRQASIPQGRARRNESGEGGSTGYNTSLWRWATSFMPSPPQSEHYGTTFPLSFRSPSSHHLATDRSWSDLQRAVGHYAKECRKDAP